MALRSRSRTATPTSGPGRGPVSDGRTRHRRHHPRGRSRQRQASAEVLRLRAEALFTERVGAGERRELGKAPPSADRDVGAPGATARVRTVADADGFDAAPEPEPCVDVDVDVDVDADADADAGVGVGVGVGVGADVEGGGGESAGPWRERAWPAVRERMPLWLQSRCGLERRSVAALTVLLVVAAVFAVQHFWTGRTQSVRAPEVVRAAAPYGEPAGQARRGPGDRGARQVVGGGASTGGASAGPVLVVDVSGKVRSPGLQRLPAGSRVEDALRAAGGVRPGVNTEGLNRARLLVDGEQVVVGAPASAAGAGPGSAGAVGAGAGASAAGAVPTAPVPLNSATVEQLDTLPGVGPVLAQHIIDYRAQHGGFRSVDELREVNGIGDRRFADLRALVRP